ncbi:hypothetical protein REPUB_Repub12eG0029500 [Reevesia pubescens]
MCYSGEQVCRNGEVSTVFVNNIRSRVHWRWLWRIFQNQGTVVDVFIPRKRSSRGRKFGFVRFVSKDDANRAVKMLNGAWRLDFRLGVNLARFNSRSNYYRKVQTSRGTNPNNQENVDNGVLNDNNTRKLVEELVEIQN